MTDKDEIMRALGRIEGRFDGIEVRLMNLETLSKRVSALEHWAAWTKGGLSLIAFLVAYVLKGWFGFGQKP